MEEITVKSFDTGPKGQNTSGKGDGTALVVAEKLGELAETIKP